MPRQHELNQHPVGRNGCRIGIWTGNNHVSHQLRIPWVAGLDLDELRAHQGLRWLDGTVCDTQIDGSRRRGRVELIGPDALRASHHESRTRCKSLLLRLRETEEGGIAKRNAWYRFSDAPNVDNPHIPERSRLLANKRDGCGCRPC